MQTPFYIKMADNGFGTRMDELLGKMEELEEKI